MCSVRQYSAVKQLDLQMWFRCISAQLIICPSHPATKLIIKQSVQELLDFLISKTLAKFHNRWA